LQTPDLTAIVYEANSGLRQIFTDGRPMPKDVEPWWYGYSIGHWEKSAGGTGESGSGTSKSGSGTSKSGSGTSENTLVVESAHFRDLGWLDVEGSPLTDSGRIIERIRRPDYGHL